VTNQILFLSGQKDELVPPTMMQTLYETCTSSKKQMHYFPNGTHNNTWIEYGYFKTIYKFLHIDNVDIVVPSRRSSSANASPVDSSPTRARDPFSPSRARARSRVRSESIAGANTTSPSARMNQSLNTSSILADEGSLYGHVAAADSSPIPVHL